MNAIETYLELDAAEEQALRERLQAEGDGTVEATELTWADKLLQRGFEQGIEQGALEAKRQTLLRLLRLRFGEPPAELAARIAGADEATLDHMVERVVLAQGLDEFAAAL